MRFACPDDEDEATRAERIARHRAEARVHVTAIRVRASTGSASYA